MSDLAKAIWSSVVEILLWGVAVFIAMLLTGMVDGADSATITKEPCEIAVEIDHYTPWGENERHRISGWFFEPRGGVYEMTCKYLTLHDLSSREVREGVRVSRIAMVKGYWMDRKRTVILPMRVEVIEGRTDITK